MDKKYVLARNLRKNSTKEEKIVWQILRNRQFFNLKFKRQVPIGEYIVDFLCEERKLIIETAVSITQLKALNMIKKEQFF